MALTSKAKDIKANTLAALFNLEASKTLAKTAAFKDTGAANPYNNTAEHS